jgi:uncharacterized membrane protein
MKPKRSLTALAALFICTGAVLTLENYRLVAGISAHWPLFLILVGSGFVLLYFKERRRDAALIWLGSFCVPIGVFFYFLNFTSWEHMAHLWPLFLGITGLSFLITTIATKSRIFLYLSFLFVTLFCALWLVFTVSIKLWPMSLVVFGLSLLSINLFANKETLQQKRTR